MNKVYLYDGSFFSLIILIESLIKLQERPQNIVSKNDYQPTLLDEVIELKLGDKIENKISKKIFHIMYYIYLSSDTNKCLVIYYLYKNYLKYKDEVLYHRNLNCVNQALKLATYVSREAHKLKGFLRFKKMKNNFYYAVINPTNNVIEILAKHFKKRLSGEYWIIKDEARNIYAVYNLKEIIYLTDKDIVSLNLKLDENEEDFEKLWKTFFETIGIKERENLRCQRNFMPKKYWKNIIEMGDKI